jgi:hypothetical protein
VSDYGLDDRVIGVRFPAGAKDFSSNLCVQTGSGALPASCTMGTGDPFPGGKARPGRDADHSPPSSVRSRTSRSYTSLPQVPSWRVAGLLYFTLFTIKFIWQRCHVTRQRKGQVFPKQEAVVNETPVLLETLGCHVNVPS